MKCINCRKKQSHTVCGSCWNYAINQLAQFSQKYNELESELLPGRGNTGQRVSGSKESTPIPGNLETLNLRSGAISIPLMKHEAVIREIRRETKLVWNSERRTTEIKRIELTTQYIINRSSWIHDNYKQADQLAATIISIFHKIQFTLGNKSEDIIIGKCPTLDDDGENCGTTLKVNPADLERTFEIKCKSCGTIWTSDKWRLLGRVLESK